jgi:hypothetical protein
VAHGDYTGQAKARLAQQYAEQQALAAQTTSMVTEVVREGQETPINLMTERDEENLLVKRQVNQQTGEEEVIEVDTPDPQFRAVKFRASEDVDQITVGQGREFSLLAGRNYIAPYWVVQHLDQQGVVYH